MGAESGRTKSRGKAMISELRAPLRRHNQAGLPAIQDAPVVNGTCIISLFVYFCVIILYVY